MKQNIIEVKNLSKEFKGQTALRDITMAIPENCVCGLLGNPYPHPAGAQRWAAVSDGGGSGLWRRLFRQRSAICCAGILQWRCEPP